jgi:regulator of cell morphogenesis and NO signaling
MSGDFTEATAIGEIAAHHPRLIPVFDRFGLDYCYHGRQPLRSACDRAGVQIGDVLATCADPAFAPSDTDPHWREMSMTLLSHDIEASHHRFARDTLRRLTELFNQLSAADVLQNPEVDQLREIVGTLHEEIMDHLVREERVLFPWLRRLEQTTAVHIGPPWSVKRPIDCMEHDHHATAEAFVKVRSVTTNYFSPPDRCGAHTEIIALLRALERDTRVHIHKENNILFPAGVRAEAGRTRIRSTGCFPPGLRDPAHLPTTHESEAAHPAAPV